MPVSCSGGRRPGGPGRGTERARPRGKGLPGGPLLLGRQAVLLLGSPGGSLRREERLKEGACPESSGVRRSLETAEGAGRRGGVWTTHLGGQVSGGAGRPVSCDHPCGLDPRIHTCALPQHVASQAGEEGQVRCQQEVLPGSTTQTLLCTRPLLSLPVRSLEIVHCD